MQPIVYIKSYGRGTALYVVKKSNVKKNQVSDYIIIILEIMVNG